jgi:hypothetical protein
MNIHRRKAMKTLSKVLALSTCFCFLVTSVALAAPPTTTRASSTSLGAAPMSARECKPAGKVTELSTGQLAVLCQDGGMLECRPIRTSKGGVAMRRQDDGSFVVPCQGGAQLIVEFEELPSTYSMAAKCPDGEACIVSTTNITVEGSGKAEPGEDGLSDALMYCGFEGNWCRPHGEKEGFYGGRYSTVR